MFRDERDALQFQADSLSQKLKENNDQLESLKEEKQQTEQENKQLKKKLSSLGALPTAPFWKRPWFLALGGMFIVGSLVFAVLYLTKPRATLTWKAALVSYSKKACTITGTFSTDGMLKSSIESLRIECEGEILKNTIYPFGGDGWRLIEYKVGDNNSFQYQLKQSDGDFRVDTTAQEASLYSKSDLSTPAYNFTIDTFSAPRTGDALFAHP